VSNPSKQKGTAAETAVVAYLRGIWPHAERRTLSGQYDKGDVSPGNGLPVVVEVKAHKTYALSEWIDELRDEMRNANAEIGFLVVKRRGKANAEDWFWITTGPVALDLLNEWGR
jgi:hypothetical protein